MAQGPPSLKVYARSPICLRLPWCPLPSNKNYQTTVAPELLLPPLAKHLRLRPKKDNYTSQVPQTPKQPPQRPAVLPARTPARSLHPPQWQSSLVGEKMSVSGLHGPVKGVSSGSGSGARAPQEHPPQAPNRNGGGGQEP